MPIWAAAMATCGRANARFNCCIRCRAAAGRAEKPGLVLLQTRNPEDAVMQALVKGDRDGFYEQERTRAKPLPRRPLAVSPRW